MQGLLAASRLRDLRRYRFAAAGAAILMVAILTGQALDGGGGPVPGSSLAPTSSGAITWTAGPSSSAGTATSWSRLNLGAEDRLADLTATEVLGRQVATTSHFVLRALGRVTAARLATSVKVEPQVALSVTPGVTPNSVSLEPASPLQEGTLYRFRLYATDGSLAGTWAFRTDAPLRVVSRIPDDRTNDVPVRTGIEVTFDQDNAIDFAAHFSILPKVDGAFEQHGRAWVFVPARPLAPETLYTITVTRGVGVANSTRVLETDLRWQFVTASADGDARDTAPKLDQTITEAREGENPIVAVHYWVDESQAPATGWPYELYRLPTLAAAADAATLLRALPEWAFGLRGAGSVVDTSNLKRVASGTATLAQTGGTYYLRLPVRPDRGWYLVVLLKEAHPTQAVLQVTDLAAFVQTTDTRTLAWLSDLKTLAPVAGASIAIHGGPSLGTTDSRGVLITPTPPSLVTYRIDPNEWAYPTAHVLEIQSPDGRGLIAVVGMASGWGYPPQVQSASEARLPVSQWWLVLSTDRQVYRSTDTIHAWGVVRARDGLGVPSSVELRLEAAGTSGGPAIATASTAPTASGVFSADLGLGDVPHGSFQVSLYVQGTRLASQAIDVSEIRKPAFAINLVADRHVYVTGDPLTVRGTVAFYDGSRTPGIGIQTTFDETSVASTTGPDGSFAAAFTARMGAGQGNEGWFWASISSVPSAPEEGAITGSMDVVVFPSRVWIDGQATLSGNRLSISGAVSRLDVAKAEAQLADGKWELDPSGAAVPSQAVGIRVVHVIPVRKQVGTTYDFISKLTKPVYEYSTREEVILTRNTVTDAKGRIALGLDVPAANDDYRVELTSRDAQNLLVRKTAYVWQRATEVQPWSYPYLVRPAGCGWPQISAGLGETTAIVAHEGDGTVGRAGQYLFMVGERGLTDVVWQSSATLQRTFTAADLPSYEVRAVRLLPTGFQVLNPVQVNVDRADKTIGVSLAAAQARYRPGETVTIAVRTTGPDGRPIAADVIVRAVDEKLFASGGALDIDVAAALLQAQPDGFLESFASHQLPYVTDGGCGGGGGGRSDFRDSATFQRISTGPDGRGAVSFTVPDDLTSWHVSASAVSATLDSGSASLLVPVGLPFFADAILAPTYLTGERPVLVVRAYGDAIHASDPVRFVVRSPDLGLDPVTVTGRAFEPVSIRLPELGPGRHDITIEASAAAGGLSDKLVRTVQVAASRLGRLEQRQQAVTATLHPDGGTGLTTYVISDAGLGSLVPILSALASEGGARVDQAGAAAVARQLLIDRFGVSPADLPSATFDMTRYESDGVGLLPYASADPDLTAMIAVVAPELLASQTQARAYLEARLAEFEGLSERRIVILAGLAGLGADVIDELRTIDPSRLTAREQMWLGLGLLASGDESAARAIERSLLSTFGQQLGAWVRLETGINAATTLEASALMLVLAGGLGDASAVGLYRYVSSQPSTEQVFPLQSIAYVKGALDRLPRAEARFAWSVGGERHEVTLAAGGAFTLTLTPSQHSTFSLERLAGDLVVSAAWRGPADVASLPATRGVAITRTVSPTNNAPRDHLVSVTLSVAFASDIPVGSFDVIDLTPSGLAPFVALPEEWPSQETEGSEPKGALRPYAVDGQQVSWILSPSSTERTFKLVYLARVVSPGTYVWEPAVVQSTDAATIGNHTAPTTFTIQ